MQEQGIIKTFEVSNGYNQTSFICLKEPDLNNFSPQEIHILDSSILNLHKKSAKYLSKKTHDNLWEKIEQAQIMPLESIFLKDIIPASDKQK